ncbi:MAG TPA: lysoplasmalogenase [bacterium]
MTLYFMIIGLLTIFVILLIRAELLQRRKQVYFFKPISTLLVISIVALSFFKMNESNLLYSAWILVALLFSLGGDVALMFKSKPAFTIGLVLFLIAHIVYSVAFLMFNGFVPQDRVFAAVLLIAAGIVYFYLYPGLVQMKIPVLLYVLIISFMLNQAIATCYGDFFNQTQTMLIAGGAALFYISDLILAVNKFAKPLKYHRVSLAFYYGGQLCLASSTLFFDVT